MTNLPLRCLDSAAGSSIHAFDLSADEWLKLSEENRNFRHLRMPCCSAPVVLRRSRLGTQHFVHRTVGDCKTAPESEAHLRLKQLVVEVARANGWEAAAEVVGASPDGDDWRADVLARKGNVKVAVEIQWSPQTQEETWRRQDRYEQSGIRCLWLLRQRDIPVDRNLPVAGIEGEPAEGFTALVPTGSGTQSLPMEQFLHAAFSRRLRFGMPTGVDATVTVWMGRMFCWSCGSETEIISGIEIAAGPQEIRFSIPGIGEHLDLVEIVWGHLPGDKKFEAIKRRFSKTQNRTYLSNGCAHCDAFIGEFFEHEAWQDQEPICVFETRISERWRAAILGHHGYQEGWGVY